VSIIIALDISLNSPGWCKIDTGNGARTFDSLDYSKLAGMERIARASRDLVDLCRTADLVVMEGLSMGLPSFNGRAFVPQGRHDLVGLTYIVRLWLFNMKRNTFLVPPTVLKKWATGKGNSPKNIMLREVSHRWNVEAADDNQADAVALAEFGRAYLDWAITGDMSGLPEFQRQCLPRAERLFEVAA
jgi:crossover junction endodeoxyribonuclease RuvC